ncbi:MAG: 1,4-dihydroxy-2-naphthoate octaprenyltransferase [Oligoflexia bacterium]|nr:1,4-dihydroxy-2-naphthoate octaprenyltransferase [Oligoflexia bacterium]MBF0367063.1 1,4-dihydroxy-2-naphthoate octaprenyltransferase [Oligoflexia bacterium]
MKTNHPRHPWILATRPKTLPAGVSPLLLAAALAYAKQGTIDITLFLLTMLTTTLLQIATNLTNDYYDAKRGLDGKDRLGPTRVTESGLIAASKVKFAFIFCFMLAFILGLYLSYCGGWPILALGILSMVVAYAYTGGPFPLSYYPLGELLAFLFFGWVAVGGTYYLLTGEFPIRTLLYYGSAPGLASAAIMSINNLRDRESDLKRGKRTLLGCFSEKRARLLPLLFLISSALLPMLEGTCFSLLAAASLLLFGRSWMKLYYAPIDRSFNQILAHVGQYLFIMTLLWSIGLISYE